MKNLYGLTVPVFENLRAILDANRMKSNQTFIFVTNNRKMSGITVHDLNPKSKEKLNKIIAKHFADTLTLVKETPTTMKFSYICEDERMLQRMQKTPESSITHRRLMVALNAMPLETIMMLGTQLNWRFDIENGQIVHAVVEG